MDIVLHLGVHRTATTTLHNALDAHKAELAKQKVAFWGPSLLQSGVLDGLFPHDGLKSSKKRGAGRAGGRLGLRRAALQKAGIETLIVSDPYLAGSLAQNLRTNRLYPGIGERAARLCHAFSGAVTKIVLGVRSQDKYWASAASRCVALGHDVPGDAACTAISEDLRSWKDVVLDVACAAPDTQLSVVPFETHYGNPLTFLSLATDTKLTWADKRFDWANRAPKRRQLRDVLHDRGQDPNLITEGEEAWTPFDAHQIEHMKETYLHDMAWLQSGADGYAELTQEDSLAGIVSAGEERGLIDEFKFQVEGSG
ncbi:MAG: hypothetical protein AAF754_17920 [Pseudomonadota bacterium]